jgi:hypothetical protein
MAIITTLNFPDGRLHYFNQGYHIKNNFNYLTALLTH